VKSVISEDRPVSDPFPTTLTYNNANQLLSESYSGGILSGASLTNGYDAVLRRLNSVALLNSSVLSSYAYAYDYASRLTNVTDGTYSAAYDFLVNSSLVSQITLKSNTNVRMTTTKQYDYLNRLQSISSAPSAPNELPGAYSYGYNAANQRSRQTLADGSFWIYQYDALGQVTSGKKYWIDGTPVPGEQLEYGFDDIGNRTSSKVGGDANGAERERKGVGQWYCHIFLEAQDAAWLASYQWNIRARFITS